MCENPKADRRGSDRPMLWRGERNPKCPLLRASTVNSDWTELRAGALDPMAAVSVSGKNSPAHAPPSAETDGFAQAGDLNDGNDPGRAAKETNADKPSYEELCDGTDNSGCPRLGTEAVSPVHARLLGSRRKPRQLPSEANALNPSRPTPNVGTKGANRLRLCGGKEDPIFANPKAGSGKLGRARLRSSEKESA